MKKLAALFLSCLFFLGTAGLSPVAAADLRSGDEVIIPSNATNLKDLYLFGGTIRVDAPVTNDVVAAGGNITLSKPVTGSAIVAGGNIIISGQINNTVRAAGGNIRIEGPVKGDVVITGGNISITKQASIDGDLIFNGGKLFLEGPVKGRAIINGGEILVNSAINGDVSGEVGKLTLGQNAKLNGNLSYKSQDKAAIAQGADVKGTTNYTPVEKKKDHSREIVTAGTLYKLLTDILLSILFIYFFTRGILAVLRRMTETPAQSGAVGLAFLILVPIAAVILLVLVWLGIASMLTYGLIVLVSIFLAKIFLGWIVMRWWQNRDKKTYDLDWKAGIVGPILLYLVLLIPVLGWLAGFVLLCISVGALVQELARLASGQKLSSGHAVTRKK